MTRLKKLTLFLLTIFPLMVSAQKDTSGSNGFYRKLQTYSESRRFTYFIYRLLFNVDSDITEPNQSSNIQEPALEGRIIRNVDIQTLEPFGTSLREPDLKPISFVQKAGNALHFRTRRRAIGQYLLFQPGEELDQFEVDETERLIRNSGFVRDVVTRLVPVGDDSVDIYVTARDHWTFKTSLNGTSSLINWKFTGYDLFGMGHRFNNSVRWDFTGPLSDKPDIAGYYRIPSIDGTYITTEASYHFSSKEKTLGLSLQRPFISPLLKNAGGMYMIRSELSDSLRTGASLFESFSYQRVRYGGWYARSFMLHKGPTPEEQSTQLILGTSYDRYSYSRLIALSDAVVNNFCNSRLTLISAGYSNRLYRKETYIFQFGELEDVPVGRKMQMNFGFENCKDLTRTYVGIQAGFAGYIRQRWYASANLESGSFFNRGHSEDVASKLKTLVISPLLVSGKWKMRFFIESDYTNGQNLTRFQTINLQSENIIPGYGSALPEGSTRIAANFTFVIFTPFEWLGFRISPVIYTAAGVIGNGLTDALHSKAYTGIGGGFAVSNIHLAQSDFKLLIGYYPQMDEHLKVSSIKAWEYSFRDFDFSKPSAVVLN